MTHEDFQKSYQAQLLTQIKGAYFQFRRRSDRQADLYGEDVCLRTERERIEQFEAVPDKPFLIVLHPTFGRPGSLAYRVWSALEQYLIQNTAPTLDISPSKLLAMVSVKKNQSRLKELHLALHQLSSTQIHYHSRPYLKSNANVTASFTLLSFETLENRKSYQITIDPLIIDQLRRKKKFYIHNHNRLETLSPCSQCFALLVLDGLTRRYIKHRQRSEKSPQFFYQKSYQRICDQWLAGAKPYATVSEAMRNHLKQRIDDLVECRILSPETRLLPSMVVEFYPGAGFLEDYSALYQNAKKTDSPYAEVKELIEYFGQCYAGGNRAPQPSDYATADKFIQQYGFQAAKQFVHFACRQAMGSKWNDIRLMKAIEKYQDDFKVLLDQNTKPAPVQRPDDNQIAEYDRHVSLIYKKSYQNLRTDQRKRVDEMVAVGLQQLPESQKEIVTQQCVAIVSNVAVPTIQQWMLKKVG